MPQNYSVRLRCPYGDTDTWVVLENRSETLDEVLASSWGFECETHGAQKEIPMEAKPVVEIVRPAPQMAASPQAAPKQKEQTANDEEPAQVPVVVYGWSKNHGSFKEETFTINISASGALVYLNTKLEIGEGCVLLNRATHKEKEIRIARVEQDATGETRVAVEFKRPDAEFWKAKRREPRKPAVFRVQVSGSDDRANHFAQTAYTVDVSGNGARLSGVSSLTKPGDVIEVKRRWHGKARYRVVWVGQIGLEQASQIGVFCLEPEKNIWGVILPESDTEEAPAEPEKKNPSNR